VVVAAGLIAVASARLAVEAGRRRRRGRWGLVQDRFSALAARCADGGTDRTTARLTNPGRGALIRACLAVPDDGDGPDPAGDPEVGRAVAVLVELLDRAAFDPSWSDDGDADADDDYRRAVAALESLERRRATLGSRRPADPALTYS
jgi:hypothetical protein